MSSSTGYKVRLQVKHNKIYTYLLPLSLALFSVKFLASILWLFTQLTYHNLEDHILEHVIRGDSWYVIVENLYQGCLLAWFQQILWLAGSPAWVWGGLYDEHICICMMVCNNNENYQAKNSWDHAYASCWQMPKKKLTLCHVTLNLPVTLVTWKIPNVTLRNVPVSVPMLTSVAVRGLRQWHSYSPISVLSFFTIEFFSFSGFSADCPE